MRGIFFTCFIAVICSIPTQAQVFQVDTILYNGSPGKYINIVYLADGYQANELENFVGHVENATQYLFSASPFDQYKDYFNVFAIRSISLESGAKHPRNASDCPSLGSHPILATSNIFGSSFDVGGIHRLLVPSVFATLNRTVSDNFPLFDQRIVLVNSTFYGGSGGTYATSSVNTAANEVVVHEIGHSFAQLADEYYAGDIFAAERSNMTRQTNPVLVKWKNWLGFEDVGIYPYGTSGNPANWFRPHENCKMRVLGPEFCPVCKEKLVQTILSNFGNPILSKVPRENAFTLQADTMLFHLNILQPKNKTIRVSWMLNGDTLSERNDSLVLSSTDFLPGNNLLIAKVLDTTAFIRANNHSQVFTYSANWTVNKSVTGIQVSKSNSRPKVYPSPTKDLLNIKLEGFENLAEIQIMSLHGKALLTKTISGNSSQIDVRSLPVGVYLVEAIYHGQSFIQYFIKE